MNYLKKRTLVFIGLLSLIATSGFGGGVSVGNNKMAYFSPKGFSVVYEESLTLAVKSESDFRISNEQLVSEKGKTSRVIFSVTENTLLNLQEIREWLAQRYLGVKFQHIKFSGAEGYYLEEKQGDKLKSHYWLLTSNKQLVDIDLEAYEAGRGLELVAPIVSTFNYDITPPVVEKVWFENNVWPAGTKQRVFFRATDDNSGVDTSKTDAYFFRGTENFNADTILSSETKEIAPGLYSIEFDVNAFIGPATFKFDGVTVYDNAGNPAIRRFTDVFTIEVTNSGPVDTTPPELLEIRKDDSVWKTGEKRRIYFRVADDISGIKEVRCGGLQSVKEYDSYSRYTKHCGNIRFEGGGWYSGEIEVRDFLPSGEYVLDNISIEDNAKNSIFPKFCEKSPEKFCENGSLTGVPLFKVRIENTGVVDVEKPEFLDLRFSSTVWKAGESQKVYLKARDTVSGLWLEGISPGGSLYPEDWKAPGAQVISIKGPAIPMGDDWYILEVTPNQFMKPGNYFLQNFAVWDKGANRADINCGHDGLPKTCKKSDGTTMPPIRIQIVR